MTEPKEQEQTLPQRRHPLVLLRETKLPLWVSLLLALLLVVAFIWSRVSIGEAEAQLEKARQEMTQKFDSDRSALLTRMQDFTARQDDESQRRFGMAVAWAVRGELIRNNLDQIDQFFNEIVRMERVQRVVLAGQDGKVLLSSDKRFQGSDFTALYPAELLSAPQVAVLAAADGSKRLVLPVMGLTAQLGTVVIDYAPVSAPTAP